MDTRLEHFCRASCGAAMLVLAACGGGGSSDTSGDGTAIPTTIDVNTTVIDGAIQNALVCFDKNGNGQCDSDEVQGRTDASGKVMLAVPSADVGKYPILAVVGTDAIDADHGPVTTAYTLSAPADQTSVVSPLTTLVQQTVANTGSTTTEAATSVQDAIGLSVSVFQDYTTASAPTDGTVSAAMVARMLVVTQQQQAGTVAGAVGTSTIDGSTITQADIDKAIQKKLLELLPSLIAALSDPAVLAATTAAEKEAALQAAASTLLASSGLTAGAMPTVVAINNQTAAAAPETTVPGPAFQVQTLNYTDAATYFVRTFTGSETQNTPDSGNNVRFVDRRQRSTAGHVAKWGSGGDPWRASDVHWSGSAWVNCPINFENVSSVRDAQGNSTYNYCDGLETGRSNRATFDITGKTMSEVYDAIRAAGYTNLTIANAASVLGGATFPTGSKVFYQTGTPLNEAIAYYPGGPGSPAGTSNVVSQYSAAVSAGGTAAAQPAGTACNSPETATPGTTSGTLEAMIASKTGTPCIYAQSSFTYGGATYTSDVPNEWWGNSTLSLGKLGSAPIGNGTAPGFYTANIPLRIAFTGSGTNPVTYYACKEVFTSGSTRNCTVIGTGTYTIATLGDARVMTLSNPPLQTAPLTYNRVFVERGGFIYYGYQSKPVVTNTARLNIFGANALLTQLGIAADDPSQPLALTAGSYQGTWDFRDASSAVSATNGVTMFLNAAGGISCQDKSTATFFGCRVSIADPATGAFTYTNVASGANASGFFDYLTGTASGVYHDPSSTPTDGNLVGSRR